MEMIIWENNDDKTKDSMDETGDALDMTSTGCVQSFHLDFIFGIQ